MILLTTCALAFAFGCSSDEAKDAASDAATKAQDSASEMMGQADSMADSAKKAVDEAHGTASDVAGAMGGDAVAACRSFAESGAWGQALEGCRKAHEMMPDDLALEHAYQQAKAAAGS
jgi:hypothetical protein